MADLIGRRSFLKRAAGIVLGAAVAPLILPSTTVVAAPAFIRSDRLDFGLPRPRLVLPTENETAEILGHQPDPFARRIAEGGWHRFGSSLLLPESEVANDRWEHSPSVQDGSSAYDEMRAYFGAHPELMTGMGTPSRWTDEERLAVQPMIWRSPFDSMVMHG